MHVLKKIDYILIISFAALFAFLALFLFRSADDNRLFNWQWVFAGVDAPRIFLFLVFGIVAAYVLSRVALFERDPVVFLFLFSFTAAAIFWTEPELIVDASRYFTQAKHLEVYGIDYFLREWGKDITAWTDMPAAPFLYGLIFKLFGESRLYIQIFLTLLFSMSVVLTYLIGKTLWDEETGFIAGLLLLGMPYLLTQVPLMLVDVPTMFFLMFSIFTFIKSLDQGKPWMIALAACAMFLAVFSKYSTWPMLSVLVIVLLVYLKKEPRPTLRRAIAVAMLSVLLIGVVVVLKFDVISGQIRLLLSYQKPGLNRWGESFISTFLFQIHPFITLAVVYSLLVAFKKRDFSYTIIAWLVVLVFVFQIRRIRYILPVFPLLALMASYGLREIESRDLKKFLAFTVVITSLVIALFAYLPFARNVSAENVKEAGAYLNSRETEAVQVFTLPLKDPVVNPSVSVPLLDLYTKKRIVYQYHPEFFSPPKNIATAALRFTWEFKNPKYYENDDDKRNITTIVVISGVRDGNRVQPQYLKDRIAGMRLLKKFETASDPFRYKTIVEIYSKP